MLKKLKMLKLAQLSAEFLELSQAVFIDVFGRHFMTSSSYARQLAVVGGVELRH